MVILPDHFGFVNGKLDLIALYKFIAPEPEAIFFEVIPGAEKMGIIGHMKHCQKPDTPWVFACLFIDKDGNAFVNLFCNFCINLCAKDGTCTSVRVKSFDVLGGKGKSAAIVVQVF